METEKDMQAENVKEIVPNMTSPREMSSQCFSHVQNGRQEQMILLEDEEDESYEIKL